MNTPSRVSRLTCRTGCPISVSSFGNSWPSSRPTMRRTSSSVSMSAVRPSCVTSPSRRTVTVSQIVKISSRRWEMKSTAAPRSLQRAHDAEQALDLVAGQRRGRLVHDQHARVEGERLGDLDDLLVGDAQAAHGLLGIELDAEPLEQVADRAVQRLAIDAAQRPERVAAHHHVLRDRAGRGRASAPGRSPRRPRRARRPGRGRRRSRRRPARRPRRDAAPRRASARSSTCRRRSRPPTPAPRPTAERSRRCATHAQPRRTCLRLQGR